MSHPATITVSNMPLSSIRMASICAESPLMQALLTVTGSVVSPMAWAIFRALSAKVSPSGPVVSPLVDESTSPTRGEATSSQGNCDKTSLTDAMTAVLKSLCANRPSAKSDPIKGSGMSHSRWSDNAVLYCLTASRLAAVVSPSGEVILSANL